MCRQLGFSRLAPTCLASYQAYDRLCAGVVGGSISTCCDGTSGYHRMAFDWISRTFPAAAPAAHAFHNGATGGIQSQYMTSCLKWHLPATVDLVIVRALNPGAPPIPQASPPAHHLPVSLHLADFQTCHVQAALE